MEGGDRDEALSTFIAVTGAEHGVAREAMETNGWDLQRALNTHLEVNHHVSSSQPLNPPQAQAVPRGQQPPRWQLPCHASRAGGAGSFPRQPAAGTAQWNSQP